MGVGQPTTRTTDATTKDSRGGEAPLYRLGRALWWELRAELYPKWVKEKLPVPDAVAEDPGHLIEDIQLGALILKLPLGLGLALAPMYAKSYQGLLAGLGSYLAADFLYQFIELSRGEETWAQRRKATLVAEVISVPLRLVGAVRGRGGRRQ